MSEEYDLSKSEKTMGQLLPVIKDAKGRIVDGLHRTKSNSAWRVEVRKEIETDEDYWKARAHLNFSRRNAQAAHEEKKTIINNLAKYYATKGLKIQVSSEKIGIGYKAPPPRARNEILDAVINALDGAMTATYIRQNIDQDYTQDQTRSEKPYLDPANVSPLDALAHDEVTVKARYGEDFTERLRKQVLAEANLSPQEKAALTKKRQEVKEAKAKKKEENKRKKEEKEKQKIEEKAKSLKANELLKDPDFRKELVTQIQRPKEEQDENSKVNREIIGKMVEEYVPAIAKAFSELKPENPHEPERNKLVLNMLLKNLEQGLIFCPICGKQMLECSSCHVSLRKMKERTKI